MDQRRFLRVPVISQPASDNLSSEEAPEGIQSMTTTTTTPKKPAVPAEKPVVAASVTENVKQALWKVMIHMAADNNLKEECLWALTEILRVGPIPKVDVIAQFDSGDSINRYDFTKLRANGNSNGNGTPGGSGQPGIAASPTPKDHIKIGALAEEIPFKLIPRQNNGHQSKELLIEKVPAPDAEVIQDFLHAAIGSSAAIPAAAPSSNPGFTTNGSASQPFNMLVLSGHGSGAVGDFFNTQNPPSALSMPDIRKEICEPLAQKLGRKIDVLGMDSCLMSMAEVCYELRNTVEYMVGSEGFEQNTGWPYHNILAALQAKPTMNPKEFACAIVKEYIHYYSDYTVAGVSVDQAACDLSQSERLKDAVTTLAQTLQDKLSDPDVENAILLAHWRAQSFKFEQYVDLWDFCDLLERGCADAEVGTACEETKKAIEKFVLISCFSGAAFQHSHGLSVYFPWAKIDLDADLPAYKKLSFHKDTKWGDFLEAYGKKTQRELRGNSGKSNHKAGKREQLFMPPKDGGEENVRTNPALEERTVDRRIVRVKNPPDHFYKYEDDCAGDCGKR
jgi:hypothetical protein